MTKMIHHTANGATGRDIGTCENKTSRVKTLSVIALMMIGHETQEATHISLTLRQTCDTCDGIPGSGLEALCDDTRCGRHQQTVEYSSTARWIP